MKPCPHNQVWKKVKHRKYGQRVVLWQRNMSHFAWSGQFEWTMFRNLKYFIRLSLWVPSDSCDKLNIYYEKYGISGWWNCITIEAPSFTYQKNFRRFTIISCWFLVYCCSNNIVQIVSVLTFLNVFSTSPDAEIPLSTEVGEGQGSFKLDGWWLKLSQFHGLIVKRFHCAKRNTKVLFSQILLPAFFVCVAMTVALSVPEIGELMWPDPSVLFYVFATAKNHWKCWALTDDSSLELASFWGLT